MEKYFFTICAVISLLVASYAIHNSNVVSHKAQILASQVKVRSAAADAALQRAVTASCEGDNATRASLKDLIHTVVTVPPNSPPDVVARYQGFLNQADRSLAPVDCSKLTGSK